MLSTAFVSFACQAKNAPLTHNTSIERITWLWSHAVLPQSNSYPHLYSSPCSVLDLAHGRNSVGSSVRKPEIEIPLWGVGGVAYGMTDLSPRCWGRPGDGPTGERIFRGRRSALRQSFHVTHWGCKRSQSAGSHRELSEEQEPEGPAQEGGTQGQRGDPKRKQEQRPVGPAVIRVCRHRCFGRTESVKFPHLVKALGTVKGPHLLLFYCLKSFSFCRNALIIYWVKSHSLLIVTSSLLLP